MLKDINDLRIFERIVARGSLSAAARELGLSLAVVSKRLGELERQLDARLLHRTTRRLSLTEEGDILHQHCLRLLSQVDEAEAALLHHHDSVTGTLHLTAPTGFGRRHLVPALSRFTREYPELRVQLALTDTVEDLAKGGFDLAIRYGEGRWPGLEARLLTRGHRVVVAHPDIAARLPIDYSATSDRAIHALMDLPWLPDPTDMEMATWLRALGADPDKARITRLETNGLALAAVRSGAGISRQPLAVVERDLEDGRLVALLEEPDSALGYYTVWNPATISPRARVVLRWLQAQV